MCLHQPPVPMDCSGLPGGHIEAAESNIGPVRISMVGYLMIIMLGLGVQRGAGIWSRRVEGVQGANRFKIDCTTKYSLIYFSFQLCHASYHQVTR